jgi:acyl-CoA dehydrogenase
MELTVEYSHQRKAFGQAVSDFQNTRFKLAECATIAHVVRSFVNDCVQRLLDGTLDDEAAYMAKWWCTEQQCKATDECLQLFGSMATWSSTRSPGCTPTPASTSSTSTLRAFS